MKLLIGAFLLLFALQSSVPFPKQNMRTYALLIKFQSHCCGVPDEVPLKRYMQKFKKQQGMKRIVAYKIAPMGREGEYFIGFTLAGFTKKQKALFIKNMKQITANMKDKGSAVAETNVTLVKEDLPAQATTTKVLY